MQEIDVCAVVKLTQTKPCADLGRCRISADNRTGAGNKPQRPAEICAEGTEHHHDPGLAGQ